MSIYLGQMQVSDSTACRLLLLGSLLLYIQTPVAVTVSSFEKCLPTGDQKIVATSESVRCPCFVSYGLTRTKRTPAYVSFDFLLARSEDFRTWNANGRKGYLPHDTLVSSLDRAATIYDTTASDGDGAYVYRSDQVQFQSSGEYVLIFRSSTSKKECLTTISYVLESIPKPCPDRLPDAPNRLASMRNHYEWVLSSLLGSLSNILLRSSRGQLAPSTIAASSRDSSENTEKIVAGTPVTEFSDRSYMALVLASETDCSGSILSSRWILTAAHCAEQHEDATPVLVTGADTSSGAQYNIKRVVLHPDYEPGSSTEFTTNDIALIELSEPIEEPFTTVAINTDLDGPNSGEFVRASGYGYISQDWTGESGQARELRRVDIPVISTRDCLKALEAANVESLNEKFKGSLQLCAGFGPSECGGDTCTGDSGGPIVARGSSSAKFVQIGVTSAGIGCGKPGLPGIYTRVAPFVEWMESVVGADVLKKATVGGRDSSITITSGGGSRSRRNKQVAVGVSVSVILLLIIGLIAGLFLHRRYRSGQSSDSLSQKKNAVGHSDSSSWSRAFRRDRTDSEDEDPDCELGVNCDRTDENGVEKPFHGGGNLRPQDATNGEQDADHTGLQTGSDSGLSSLANSLLRNPLLAVRQRLMSLPAVRSHMDTDSELEAISSVANACGTGENALDDTSNLARMARSAHCRERQLSQLSQLSQKISDGLLSDDTSSDLSHSPSLRISHGSAEEVSSDIRVDLTPEKPDMPSLGISRIRFDGERQDGPSSTPANERASQQDQSATAEAKSESTSDTFYSMSSHRTDADHGPCPRPR